MKEGDKVKYTGPKGGVNKSMSTPDKDEVIIIKCKCNIHLNHFDIIGYEKDSSGRAQSFDVIHLIKA